MTRDPVQKGEELDDAVLVIAARDGEEWAAETLFLRYAPMVDSLAFRLAPHHESIEDLVQEIFVQALDNLHRLQDPQAFAAWLKSIAVRTAAKKIRRVRMRAKLGLYRGSPIDWNRAISQFAPPDVIFELRAIYSEIERLPAECRVALVLKRVEGLSLPEIASLMKLSEGTVKRRIKKADGLLRNPETKKRSQP